MRSCPYLFFTVAALAAISTLSILSAGCNRDIAYHETDPAGDPVTVFEYVPAPGQFINEMPAFDGVDTPLAARRFAEKRLNYVSPDNGRAVERYVSLGAFGGYIVVGFGKSIENTGGYDFSITGNQQPGGSEPGIVWVMQDVDGDGMPDRDGVWYELKGSESGEPGTVRGYEVTYFRPAEANVAVEWQDNMGGSGTVERARDENGAEFHDQASYCPAWIDTDSYTLSGTMLKSRSSYDEATRDWDNGSYGWGYADNWGSDRGEDAADQRKVYFKISNAVDAEGDPVALEWVDFIKVQSAVNANAGRLGEVSTEVTRFAIGPK